MDNINNINNIIFYNFHVNGDCFTSRILVKHIIENTKDINYYYTSHRSLASHCLDLGIPDDRFNTFPLPHNSENLVVNFVNDCLYINTWMGMNCDLGSCVFCLNSYIKYFNSIVTLANEATASKIPLISNDTLPVIQFNYNFYNCEHFDNYFKEIKKTFSKVILIYNGLSGTYVKVNNIKHVGYLNILTEKYPDYFFLTFNETEIEKNNIICAKTIYEKNARSSINYGIEFSYLTNLCDKILYIPSGLSLLGFYNTPKIKNKCAILFCICDEQTGKFVCDEYSSDNLCLEKYKIYIKKIWINKTTFEVMNEIEEFINLQTVYE